MDSGTNCLLPSSLPRDAQPADCYVCEETLPRKELIRLSCRHRWCRPCLNQYISVAFSSRRNYPPSCCARNDGVSIDVSAVQGCLDDEVLLRVVNRWEEYTTEHPIYCADLHCGQVIPQIPIDDPLAQFVPCRRCQHATCRLCRCLQTAHSGIGFSNTLLHGTISTCPEEIACARTRRLIKKQGWKHCPGCRAVVDRIQGCRIMNCPCGTQFCYDCGGTLRGMRRGHLRLLKRCYCDDDEGENMACWCFWFCVLCVATAFAMGAIVWAAGRDYWRQLN